jgi:hypothetical protein
MLARIPELKRTVASALLTAAAFLLISFASEKQQVAIVNDPDAKNKEYKIPWNKQEKWEVGSDMAAVTDRGR